ncbi:hypothetical protein K458DRAFT_466942 [Lentithecium fluviatile CBS 122367]|uniref:Heterokaryon incompatibility domain-containing protein n=1 Tax=Lentithecium fluviatile CBS 122367 TaxID=1168545 RepID=A0A6G1IG16_9PLEO|nr:hypothetical protein K458DRAFT_466942 [Lentithecium fluviatile CBS 122367]
MYGHAQRRPQFPSWSWVAWSGAVSMMNDVVIDQICAIRIGDGRDTWHTILEYVRTGKAKREAGSTQALRYLELTGPTLALIVPREVGRNEYYGKKNFGLRSLQGGSQKAALIPRVYLDGVPENRQGQVELQECIAMAMCDQRSRLWALILRPSREGGSWERTGILRALKKGPKNGLKVLEIWREQSEMKTVIVA